MTNISENIRVLRLSRGWTQEELAAAWVIRKVQKR